MPLVATALLPHTPLLRPDVGKDHAQQLQRTAETVNRIATELYALQPQLVVVLTPHGTVLRNSFFCNLADRYACSLEQFGDFTSRLDVAGNAAVAYRLKRTAEQHHFPITLGTQVNADYGTTLALLPLAELTRSASALIVSPSDLPLEEHRSFGSLIANALISGRERAVVVASVELSHHVNPASPQGARPAGRQYDTTIIQVLRKGDLNDILTIDPQLVREAETCSQSIFALVAGILRNRQTRPTVLTYEAPFGVGECAALFTTL